MDNYISRDLEKKIIAASKEYSCILITGARQVGKSTVLKKLMEKEREEVSLDDMVERKLASKDPALFLQMHSTPILIDEVQYSPELFSYIKIVPSFTFFGRRFKSISTISLVSRF